MFRYMTQEQAILNGFTHHGSYYGIPLWLAPDHPDFPVSTKWEPMECVMTLFHYIEGFTRPILFPDDEPCFQFKIRRPIKNS